MSCTTILVGKNASYDGSTIAARIEDSASGMFKAKKFIVVEPKDQPIHYKSVRTDCEIELPDNPMRYTCVPNVKKWRGVWGACGVNEKNVALTATETIAVNELVLGADPLVEYVEGEVKKGGIGEEDFVTIVLPYISTAREGVLRLGALLEKYGTYEVNAIAIHDVDEIWWLETIGGHHWMARRVPDDAYVVNPNQLGSDYFDFEDKENFLCSDDLKEFVEENHLNLNKDGKFNPRLVFGTNSDSDKVYNTPRAWIMLRYFNRNSYKWDGPDADYRPDSENLPWCLVPERKITIEDVKYVMSHHYQGTPYDCYGNNTNPNEKGIFRPIGISRNDVLGITQIRPYMPEAIRSIQWLAFGSNVYNAIVPFYPNVRKTPEYLSNTTLKPSVENVYWANRIIAALCDPHFNTTNQHVERYQLAVQSKGHEIINKTDKKFLAEEGQIDVHDLLEEANEEMAAYLEEETTDLLDTVLYVASMAMKNGFARSDN
ncbi:dipeptidase [Atopobacter sp. AH10]|uniref:C69 family dipeptidase n=1 Tax=Atopobacter sp. AH10 TaxID=2315861 RepID=UPI000EF18400|nr:C69 family dipeptidase [Atopobacter sp. AH10]RLK63474.1 dipeptidase [Atopobacter sp. AH10]